MTLSLCRVFLGLGGGFWQGEGNESKMFPSAIISCTLLENLALPVNIPKATEIAPLYFQII